MAKKKAQKDKKEKKSKIETKETLSNLEQEKYLLEIENLEHKIECRRNTLDNIHRSKRLYEDACKLQKEDHAAAVAILEQAIEDQKQKILIVERVVSRLEEQKKETEKDNAMLMATKLKKMQEDTVQEQDAVQKMQEELDILQNYDTEKEQEGLRRLEAELQEDVSEEERIRRDRQDKRRTDTFNRKISDIVDEEKEKFSSELEASIPEETRRIEDENVQLREQIVFLNHHLNHHEAIRKKYASTVDRMRKSLKYEKELCDKAFQDLRDLELATLEAQADNEDLKNDATELLTTDPPREKVNKVFEVFRSEGDSFDESFRQMKRKEEEIRCLEEELSKEVTFGEDLQGFVERARKIIEVEAKTPLVLTYNGTPEKRETVRDLLKVFEEATTFIYERGDRTMV